MNNADMPAMPMGPGATGSYFTANDLGDGYAEQCRPAFGLTKREYFAGLAMQAFITADHLNGSEKRLNEDNALMAVDAADALIAELDKEKQQ